VQPATAQRILRDSSITVTTGTYVDVIEAIQRDALDSMGSLFGADIDAGSSPITPDNKLFVTHRNRSTTVVKRDFVHSLEASNAWWS
jgi:hypothetical protein